MGKVLIGIIVLVLVIGVIAANVGQKTEEPVQLGSKEKVVKSEPKSETPSETPPVVASAAEATKKASRQ